MKKFTFLSPIGKIRGVLPRCQKIHPHQSGAHCTRPSQHKGQHEWDQKITAKRLSPGEPAKEKIHRGAKISRLDCAQMIEDPIYRRKLLLDLRARKLRPAVECMLWYYAKGKPKEMVEHSGTLSLQQELSALSPEELRQRALDVAAMLTNGRVPPALKPSVH